MKYMIFNCSLSCGFCKGNVDDGTVSGRDGDYVVYTRSCRILDIDPWHVSIKKYVETETRPLICMKYKKLANLDKGVLTPTEGLRQLGSVVKCTFSPITRSFVEKNDSKWDLGKPVDLPLFDNKGVNVSADFVHVHCVSDKDRLVYDDFLTQTFVGNYYKYKNKMNMLPTPKAGLRIKRNKIDEELNILMIGIDSMSRLNGHRQLTKLREYMLKDLKGVELNGYNRVGDNTFLNICPLTMGKTIDETKWDSSRHLDDQPFIWKRFMSKGYASLYAEDATEGSIFNYLKKGFSKYPAHHYYRHMSLALEKSALHERSPMWCCGRKGLHKWTLDYARQFATTYHAAKIPFFAFVFNTFISHDNINAVGKTDEHYTEFVRYINSSNIINNTVVIIFGDHGYRFGGIRSSYVGRYEENLPMIFITFPPWFGKKYPYYDKALRRNQHMLTSPFDVHQMLRDLCVGCGYDKPSDYGISLFENIPKDRVCSEAGIAIHFCACREEKKLKVTNSNVVQASKALLSRINELSNMKKGLCLEQEITKIIDASTSVHDQTYSKGCTVKGVCYDSNWHRLQTSFTLYLITIQTQPGSGQFQATVRHEQNKFQVMGDISRTNSYGKTSSCITDDFNLVKFCYCRSNIY